MMLVKTLLRMQKTENLQNQRMKTLMQVIMNDTWRKKDSFKENSFFKGRSFLYLHFLQSHSLRLHFLQNHFLGVHFLRLQHFQSILLFSLNYIVIIKVYHIIKPNMFYVISFQEFVKYILRVLSFRDRIISCFNF